MPPTCADCREPLVEAVVENLTGRKALVSTYSMTERCTKSADRRHHTKAETKTCGCCERTLPASQVPFNHRFRDGRPDMDYCVDCNDAGCDLDTCELPTKEADVATPQAPGVLPPNLSAEQYKHLHDNLELFQAGKGEDIIEYFTDHADNPRYRDDLYERVCADLGLVPIGTTPEDVAQGATSAPLPETLNPAQIADFVQAQVAQAMGGLLGNQTPVQTGPVDFEDVLNEVDEKDSDAALAMLDFLLRTGRLGKVGVLDGGQGYLFIYAEPKGSSKEGYRPGATQGDRIVDAAVKQQRDSGAGPTVRGLCKHCYSGVKEMAVEGQPMGVLVVEATGDATCPKNDGGHELAG